MRRQFAADFLRCPRCRTDASFTLEGSVEDEREVREGTLACDRCGARFAVQRGVGELLLNAPEYIEKEAAGLGRFAEFMANTGWTRERVLNLPNEPDGYWFVQRTSFEQFLAVVDFSPGQSLVDVGSNTCWAAGAFADLGLQAIALDIATSELQGLYTADFYLQAGRSYFERVLGSMADMPLAGGTLDYVFCCEVLHHNDIGGLAKTLAEAYRVLKPGGKLLVVNETLKRLTDRSGVHIEGVEQFEGYEHAHWAIEYRGLARRAGFRTQVLPPLYVPFFQPPELHLPAGTGLRDALGATKWYWLRRVPGARAIRLAWANHVRGPAQFNMIATKPAG